MYEILNVKYTYLLQASTVIEKHKATRKTAFTRAPRTSARAQPNVFLDHFFGDICGHNRSQFSGLLPPYICEENS